MGAARSPEVIVLIGAGAIGQAIAAGKQLLLADVSESNAKPRVILCHPLGIKSAPNSWMCHRGKWYMRWQPQPPSWAISQV
jgi:hypothetical protein